MERTLTPPEIADVLSIPLGLCQCGCGQKTSISKKNNRTLGHVKGQPQRFRSGHSLLPKGPGKREQHHSWKGGRNLTRGYVRLRDPFHPNANKSGHVYEHIVIAAKALGKPLPFGVEVHHANGVRADNHNSNLVICQDRAYHRLLHVRIRALKACGNPFFRQCRMCHGWESPENLAIYGNTITHWECQRAYVNKMSAKKRGL